VSCGEVLLLKALNIDSSTQFDAVRLGLFFAHWNKNIQRYFEHIFLLIMV